jgi:hypothetical protein
MLVGWMGGCFLAVSLEAGKGNIEQGCWSSDNCPTMKYLHVDKLCSSFCRSPSAGCVAYIRLHCLCVNVTR